MMKIYAGVKVNQSHNTPKEAQGERRYSSYSFTTSALDGGEWSASRPGLALPPRENMQAYPVSNFRIPESGCFFALASTVHSAQAATHREVISPNIKLECYIAHKCGNKKSGCVTCSLLLHIFYYF
jgi:hypothetical protein